MHNNLEINNHVNNNFKNATYRSLIIPFSFLFFLIIYFILINENDNIVDGYINIQKELFYTINTNLSILPDLQLNLTQLGDVLIFFTFISIFIIYARKLWEVLLISSILSSVVTYGLKTYFDVPRPIKVLDLDRLITIGEPHWGYASFPSGHSIATFVVITTLLFAFMPKKNSHKIIWSIFILTLGLVIAFSRVGVGAHYPFDVIIGSIIGFIVTVIGIIISFKVNWPVWNFNKKYSFILMAVLLIWMVVIVKKILENNLPIFYFSIISLSITFYLLLSFYVKQKNKI